MKYQESVNLLQSQGKFYINLGLERILSVMEKLNNPQKNLKVIHVAGTNGKGSVCATIANILTHAGYKTGLYTSPHLVEYTERIKIDGEEISKNDFAKYISLICKTSDELTEFEILTASAIKYFSDNNVDFAILETGLGGRYDATNICDNTISVITSISLDHTDRLGKTIDEIAYEKAGIIKENSTIITAKYNHGYKTIKKIAKEKCAKLIDINHKIEMTYENKQNYAIINGEKYEFSLLGLYQKENLALVLECANLLNIPFSAIEKGLKSVKWNARLEYLKNKNILIDGAHNPDSAKALKDSLDYYFKDEKKFFIYGTIDTKDYKTIANILFKPNDEIYYYEFKHKNAVSFEKYKNDLPNLNIKKVENLNNLLDKNGLKIITGSLYMIGEIYK